MSAQLSLEKWDYASTDEIGLSQLSANIFIHQTINVLCRNNVVQQISNYHQTQQTMKSKLIQSFGKTEQPINHRNIVHGNRLSSLIAVKEGKCLLQCCKHSY